MFRQAEQKKKDGEVRESGGEKEWKRGREGDISSIRKNKSRIQDYYNRVSKVSSF